MNINKVLIQYEPYFKKLLYKEFRAFKHINLLMDMDDALQEFRIRFWKSFKRRYNPEKYTVNQFVYGFSPYIARNVKVGIVTNMSYTGRLHSTRSQPMKVQLNSISIDNPRAVSNKFFKYKRDVTIAYTRRYQVFSSDDQINDLLYYRKT